MTLTLQEGINTLLAGNVLTWDRHDSYQKGDVALVTPGARRLFEYLLSQPIESVEAGSEHLFDEIIASWENDEYDPKDHQTGNDAASIVDGFRLAYIETEGFGGLNLFDGPAFKLDINRQSWCLEGQNGSGKTSLISAIIWALTGQRIREHIGPIKDDGKREPVYGSKGKQIGTWPPLVSYPLDRADLVKDAMVRVKLIFQDSSGNEAIAERSTVCKENDDVGQVEKSIDNRLLVSPQLIETGILMPSRLTYINFGQKSQTLYEAVKSLTGLDHLGAIGDGVAVITHGGRKFLKYAKDHGITRIESDFTKHIARANDHAKEIKLDLSLVQNIDNKDLQDELKKIIVAVSMQASEYTESLESKVSENIDLSDAKDRQKVIEAVGQAKSVASRASSEVQAFKILKALYDAKADKRLNAIPTVLAASLEKLATAIEWAARQKKDKKLRLKALASKWYDAPEDLNELSICPLCISELSSPEQKKLAEELKVLKVAGEEAERRLEDECLSLRDELMNSLPENLKDKLNILGKMEPKSEIVSAANNIFTEQPPFSNIFTGTSEILGVSIANKSENLSVFESVLPPPDKTNEPDCVGQVRDVIFQIQRALELAEWWSGQRDEFGLFWKNVIGLVPNSEEPAPDTLRGIISKIEEALVAAQPYDSVAKELVDIQQFALEWQEITDEQERRKAIAEALAPLKGLRVFVDAETARSIVTLSDRIKEILDRIHIKERLGFHDAGLKKKEVHVHGSFSEEMKIDALPIANTSWLRSILWAFTYALREQAVASLSANPFPLILLDDPQVTYGYFRISQG